MYSYSYYRITFALKFTNSNPKSNLKCEMEKFEEKLCRYREPRFLFSCFQIHLIFCRSLLISGPAFNSP